MCDPLRPPFPFSAVANATNGTPSVRLRMNVRTESKGLDDQAPDSPARRLSPALRAKLKAIEPAVKKWLAANPKRARQFALDPVNVLREIAPGLDTSAVGEIKRLRASSSTRSQHFGGPIKLRDVAFDSRPRKLGAKS